MTNRYPGQCLRCRKQVDAGEGTIIKRDSRWETLCKACAPATAAVSSAQASCDVISVRPYGSDSASVTPSGRLGNTWDKYKTTCDANGARYNKDAHAQLARLSDLPSLLLALRNAGFVLDVAPVLQQTVAAKAAQTSSEVAAADGRAAAVDADLRSRGLALYPYQRDGITWLAPRSSALLADSMGLGKSCMALVAAPTGAPILVICPAIAKGVWARETAKWRPDLKSVALSGRGSFRWPAVGEVVATNFDILPAVKAGEKDAERPAEFLSACPSGTVLVVDECHACKTSKAQRTERVRAIAAAVRKAGGRTWFLTGTPLLNRPPELWSVLRGLGSAETLFGSFFRFAGMAGGSQREIKAQGGRRVLVWQWNPYGARPEVAVTLKKIMLRRMKEEVLADLPPKTRQDIPVDLDNATKRLCDEALRAVEQRGMTIEEAVELATGAGGLGFEEVSRARAALATAKLDALLNLVESYEEAGEPLVVFSAHRAPIDALATREGWAVITGDTSAEARTEIENRFQRGELLGVGATIKAGGVAITLTRASHAVFVDLDWTPALNLQAEDRIWRIGAKRAVLIQRLVAEHALDERIAKLLADKQNLVSATVDAAATHAGERVATNTAADAMQALAGQGDALQAMQAARDEMAKTQAAAEAEMAVILAEVEAEENARLAAREEKAAWQALSPDEKKAQAFTRLVERAKARRRAMVDGQSVRPAKNALETWAAAGLVRLAAADSDYAQIENSVGFSKSATGIGHAFAAAVQTDGLTEVEWRQAVLLCRSYRGQVGAPPETEE